jgi:RNA polymerase sigma factor (sigma-70 family)
MSTPIGDRVQLYALARGGDERALETLLRVSRPDLERYARRHCESDDVEEAVQDALWILYRRLGGLWSIAAFSGWLFQVVRRACLGLARRRKRHVSIDEVPESQLCDDAASDAELRVRLSRIISSLPPAYREVLLLKDVQGLSAEEIAELLEVSIEAAKSRLHRGRAIVRAGLRNDAHTQNAGAMA